MLKVGSPTGSASRVPGQVACGGSVLDPILIASVPHRNLTAFRDLSGTIESMHRAIAQAAFALTGTAYRILPPGAPGPARGGDAGPQPDAPGGPLVLRSAGGGPVGELYMGALPGPNS